MDLDFCDSISKDVLEYMDSGWKGEQEMREMFVYEEKRAKLRAITKNHEKIIGIIEAARKRNEITTPECSNLIEKVIYAIASGAKYDYADSVEDLQKIFIMAVYGLERAESMGVFASNQTRKPKGLEQYSTSQLKAELRRRKGNKK